MYELKMADPRWRTVPDPSLMINDVIMTLLLLLKVINLLANLLILLDTLLFKYFTSLCQVSLYVGNDDYIFLCNFDGSIISGFLRL